MRDLRRALAQPDTILFVGAGLSVWSGLPSWATLLEKLADFLEAQGMRANIVRAETLRGDLLQAASYGFHNLTKSQIGAFIRQACQWGTAVPHPIHRALVALGPRCFVTTNYDDLIEQSLRRWCPGRFFRPPVTNRHLTELAEIVHARATDFVFKPHGDAGDGESIILTREQYRQLLPGGERHATLETIRMLLASRPVVYVGFGLRDPDFIYVRDLLANTYQGGARDHYAIVPDVSEAEIQYWRAAYGIHLIGYETLENKDGSRDHKPLQDFLEDLVPMTGSAAEEELSTFSPTSTDTVLLLARHAARLSRAPRCTPELPIHVHVADVGCQQRRSEPDRFDGAPVERLLEHGPSRIVLIGPPGAGKSYAFRRAAARLGEALRERCLADVFEPSPLVVPVLADLKLYRGNVRALVDANLPPGLSLEKLSGRVRLRVFLDSFNEMPREHWESDAHEKDFAQLLTAHPDLSLVIGSRTTDGLVDLGATFYRLDQIADEFVVAELTRQQLLETGPYQKETIWLLQKPFFFQLVSTRAITLPDGARPRDVYDAFLARLAVQFRERFQTDSLDLVKVLQLVAFRALSTGEEALPLADVLVQLTTELEASGPPITTAVDVANWLVSQSFFVPYRGSRIAFFHQSVTEFLAARELALRYQQHPGTLVDKLRLRRWDQCLFLAVSLLSPPWDRKFLDRIIETDFGLALDAVRYLEHGRDEVIRLLLSELVERAGDIDNTEFEWKVKSLPLVESHVPQVRALMATGGLLGAAAAVRVVELSGPVVKDEFLRMLLEERQDYNYCCHGLAVALRPLVITADLTSIMTMADSIEDEVIASTSRDIAVGFISGAAETISELDVSSVRAAVLPSDPTARIPEVRARIACRYVSDRHSTEALEFAGEMLLRGVKEAATAIYFIVNFAKTEDCVLSSALSVEHIEHLLTHLWSGHDDNWNFKALRCLCEARSEFSDYVELSAAAVNGLGQAVVRSCARPSETSGVFDALSALAAMSPEDREREPYYILPQLDIDWTGREALFLRLLRLRERELAAALLHNEAYRGTLGELDVGNVEWWLDWLAEETTAESSRWFCYWLSQVLVRRSSAATQRAFVAEFNRSGSRYRVLLAGHILPHLAGLTTDAFNEDAIAFLLRAIEEFGESKQLLGSTATEAFVAERLLPRLGRGRGSSRALEQVLVEAGSRHGRRYVATGSEQPLGTSNRDSAASSGDASTTR